MSGRRCKALRKAFIAQHGRPPSRTRWTTSGLQHGYYKSEWCRVKKAWRAR